jgi:hypothetical protein
MAEQASAVPIAFTFANGARVDGTPTAFDTPGPADGTAFMLESGLKLTSISASAPNYEDTDPASNTFSWTPGDFVAATTNYGSLTQLAISNPAIPGNNDSNNVNPQESWTIAFDAPVIIRTIDTRRFDESDTMRVTVGASVFNFGFSDFDVDDVTSDPLGASFVVPANTNITILNSAVYAAFPLTGSNPDGGLSWGLDGLTVELVPEPSCFAIMCVGIVGVAAMRRRGR